MSPEALTIQCPAKINLALSVGTQDEQSGMHPICSWMVAVDGLGDTLTLKTAEGESSSFVIQAATDALASIQIDWPLEQDLSYRAHAIMQEHAGRRLPIDAFLEKRIPSYAGLGGGSSDAAGMLFGLNSLFDLGLAKTTLIELGMRLGSDVGFLVGAHHGTNSAVVSGFGEQIEAAPARGTLRIIITTLPARCSTAEVYRRFDCLYPSARVEQERVWSLAKSESLRPGDPFNDLAEAAFEVEPMLRGLHQIYQKRVEWPVHISGSGASIFMVVGSDDEAERLKRFVEYDIHAPAIVTTVNR